MVLVHAFGGSIPSSPATETVGLMTGFFRGYWSGFELRYVATSVDQPASDEGND